MSTRASVIGWRASECWGKYRMRQWINLFERYEVPSFQDAVTDDLLDEIIQTGKFVHHGADIEDQWDGGVFEYDAESFPEIVGKPFDEIRYTPEFRQTLRKALLRFAAEHQRDLENGSAYHGFEGLTPETQIYRGVTGSLNADGSVGVYWSLLKSQSVGRFINEEAGGILMVAKLKDVTVNWEATIRSRLDLSNGSDEQEIQLLKGTPVKAMAYNVNYNNGRPAFTNGSYIFKKA